MRRVLIGIIAVVVTALLTAKGQIPAAKSGTSAVLPAADLQVILLGTGFPRPYPDRAGPSTLVIANGKYFVVDAGRAIMMPLAGLGQKMLHAGDLQVPATPRIEAVLLTHLHPDHISGLPDLFVSTAETRWPAPLEIYGPEGVQGMADGILNFYAYTIQLGRGGSRPDSVDKISVHTVSEGVVYDQGGVKITAFLVDHRPVEPAFGYRFDVGDKSVVISGDTGLTPNLVKFARGANILIHEVFEPGYFGTNPVLTRYHTDAEQVGRVAAEVGVKQLVLTHVIPPEHSEHIRELAARNYKGPITVGNDLMRFTVAGAK